MTWSQRTAATACRVSGWGPRHPKAPDRSACPTQNLHIGVSINGGTPKRMVYEWKILLKWMIWGYPYFRNPPHDDFVGKSKNEKIKAKANQTSKQHNHCNKTSAASNRCHPKKTIYMFHFHTSASLTGKKTLGRATNGYKEQWGRMNWGQKKKRPRRKKWHGMAWIGMVVFRMFFKENTKTIQKGRTKHIDFIFRFIGFPLSHLPSLPFSLLFPPAFPFPSSSLPSTLFPSLLFVSLPFLFYVFFSPPPPSFLFSPLPFPSIHFFLFLSSFTFCPPSLSSPAPLLQTLPPPIFFRVVFSREIGLEWSFGG